MRYNHDENFAWPRNPFGTKRAQERFLAHVSRILFAADHSVRKGVDGTLPPQHQLVEAVCVAANRSGDELLVRPRHAVRGRPFLRGFGPNLTCNKLDGGRPGIGTGVF